MAFQRRTAAAVTECIKNSRGFDNVIEKVKILAVGNGQCTAELFIDESHTNSMGGLHGGLSATLVDCISSYALTSQEQWAIPSVSIDMNITYLKEATVGQWIFIDAKTVKADKTLAFLDVLITNKQTGDVLIRGSHTRFATR